MAESTAPASFITPADELYKALTTVHAAADHPKDGRPSLTGATLDLDGPRLMVLGTDTHRMHLYPLRNERSAGNWQLALNKANYDQAVTFLKSLGSAIVTLTYDDGPIALKIEGGGRTLSVVVDAASPLSWRRVLPDPANFCFTWHTNRAALLAVLKESKKIAKSDFMRTIFDGAHGSGMTVSARTAATSKLFAEYKTAPLGQLTSKDSAGGLTFACNNTYLQDALQAFPDAQDVYIHLTNYQRPFIVSPGAPVTDSGEFPGTPVALIMPMERNRP